MSGREVDPKTMEFFWRQTELLNRFSGVEEDLLYATDAYLHSIQEKPPFARKLYAEGFQDAVKEISWILKSRFSEIARELERLNKQEDAEKQRKDL